MRILFLLTIFLMHTKLFAQHQNPKYFLNLEKISLENTFVFPQNISSINVKKDKDTGEIYILTREVPWKYKTVHILITDSYDNQYDEILSDSSLTKIFYIDNRIINDPEIARIDQSYFCEMTIFDLSKSRQISDSCRKTCIISLILQKEKPEKKIYIRGNDLLKN